MKLGNQDLQLEQIQNNMQNKQSDSDETIESGLSFNIFEEIQFEFLYIYYENSLINTYNLKLY